MGKIFLHFAMTADGMVSNVEQWVSFTEEALNLLGRQSHCL